MHQGVVHPETTEDDVDDGGGEVVKEKIKEDDVVSVKVRIESLHECQESDYFNNI